MSALESIATKQGWQKQFEELRKRSFWNLGCEIRAIRHETPIQCVVVLVRDYSICIPGFDTQSAILLDNKGNLMDCLVCRFNTRLRRDFKVVTPDKPEPDGAQIVFRLEGANGNFSHTIHHAGRTMKFYWGDADKWQKKGLCRISIKDAKLKVLFPEKQDEFQRSGH